MNREEIIRMAGEAGMSVALDEWIATDDQLDRFAALVAAAEREACAKICEDERENYIDIAEKNNGMESDFAFGRVNAAEEIAITIRAQGNGGDK